MEPINKQFDQCPNCGSRERFCETLANELKEKGYAGEKWKYGFDFRQGVVIDPTREAAIPIGASVPSFQITTDICLDCGTIYAVDLKSSTVTKSIAPPKIIKPGDNLPPVGNDPRFS